MKDGQAFKDSNGNIYVGTLNNSQINGKTLTPATQTEYIQYCLGTGNDRSAEHPYTISDANGWIAFCIARFSAVRISRAASRCDCATSIISARIA